MIQIPDLENINPKVRAPKPMRLFCFFPKGINHIQIEKHKERFTFNSGIAWLNMVLALNRLEAVRNRVNLLPTSLLLHEVRSAKSASKIFTLSFLKILHM